MMQYTLYQITNQINGKIYIGIHQTENPEDNYYGSGKLILAALKKHGKQNFRKEILFVFDSKEQMINAEREIVNEIFILRDDTYNVTLGGSLPPNMKGIPKTAEHNQKNRESNKGRNEGKTYEEILGNEKAKDTKRKQREARKNYIQPEATKEKIGNSNRGKIRTQEMRIHMSKVKTGITWEMCLGKKEAKKRKQQKSKSMSGENNHFYGKTHTEEALEKLRKNSKEERHAIYLEFKAGATRKELAKKHDIGCDDVSRYVNEFEKGLIKNGNNKYTDKQILEIYNEYLNGSSMNELSIKYHVSLTTIKLYTKKGLYGL